MTLVRRLAADAKGWLAGLGVPFVAAPAPGYRFIDPDPGAYAFTEPDEEIFLHVVGNAGTLTSRLVRLRLVRLPSV